jgi:signal transduction histidine kinase
MRKLRYVLLAAVVIARVQDTGTGLGLSAVKKIVDLHGGAIDVQIVPEGGVRVTLALTADPKKTR